MAEVLRSGMITEVLKGYWVIPFVSIKECPTTRAVLAYSGLNNKLLDGNSSRCIIWIEDVARVLDKKVVSDFITVLWNVWNSRNNFIFQGIDEEAKVIWERVASLSQDFQIFNLLEKPMLPRTAMEKVWRKPSQGVVKINFNAIVAGKTTS
ncbi:hypothetical protein Goari_016693 [Gossypium aridum]|uniref:Uncharacterized protein n=1 Tax=Gossypium aridum TaxID=34290 RepID=A0A7J8WJK7_GOSAI|nr:hypothetical protein [Gossypium aridum]